SKWKARPARAVVLRFRFHTCRPLDQLAESPSRQAQGKAGATSRLRVLGESSTNCKRVFRLSSRREPIIRPLTLPEATSASQGAPLLNAATKPDTASFIVPDTNDRHDRMYRFGKPLTYLSDRQQVRLLIVRGRVREAHAAQVESPTVSLC